MSQADPVKGRVLLSQKRLVLAADAHDDKLTIPLSDIFDVAVGHVPPDLGEFFNSTVTLAFKHGSSRRVAAVESDDDKIGKFATVLYRVLLNGTEVSVKHPARVGGRVTDESFAAANLVMKPEGVQFQRPDATFTIDLSAVTDFEQITREISGSERAAIAVQHQDGGQAQTTLIAVPSSRKLNLMGRYIRKEYRELQEELSDISLSKDEKRTIVAIYSAPQGIALADMLDKEASEITMLLQDLTEADLVVDEPEGPTLTSKGQMLASRYLEDVNA
jgi:helix-turn-helix protein